MDKSSDKAFSVPVSQLRFDPDNPRLPSTINGKVLSQIIDWMINRESVIELMGAIGENDYFAGEPLLVVRDNKPDCYVVIEGNRRLAAVKLLNDPSIAPVRSKSVQEISETAKHTPKSLPVIVFPDRDDILDYLGFRHITGVKPWDSLAKAKYLEQLSQRMKGPLSQKKYQTLAKSIGSRWDTVAKLLTGLSIYRRIDKENFFGIKDLDEESFDFALLTTALGYKNILSFLGLDRATDPELKGLSISDLKFLTVFIFERDEGSVSKLGESRNLKKLNRVLGNDEARTALKNGLSLDDADLRAGAPLEILQNAIRESRNILRAGRDQIHLVTHTSQTDVDVLEDIEKMARLMRTVLRDKIVDVPDNSN